MSSFKKKLGILADFRAVEDPLGCGVTLLIRSKRHPAYIAFCKTQLPKSEFTEALQREIGREQMRASMTGKKMNKEAAIDRAFDKVEVDAQSSQVYVDWNVHRVAHLLEGWEGNDEPFTLEAAIETLSIATPLDPALPYASEEKDLDEDELEVEKNKAARENREPKTTRTITRNLGEALMAFIEEESDKEALFVEGLAKNSAASSVSAPASSAD